MQSCLERHSDSGTIRGRGRGTDRQSKCVCIKDGAGSKGGRTGEKREREQDRQAGRQAGRQADKDRHTHARAHTHTHTHRERERERERERARERELDGLVSNHKKPEVRVVDSVLDCLISRYILS